MTRPQVRKEPECFPLKRDDPGSRVAERRVDSRRLYLRLLSYVRPHARIFGIAVLAMVATAATEPLFPAFMKPLLDGGFSGQSGGAAFTPLQFALALVGIFMLRGIFSFVASYCSAAVPSSSRHSPHRRPSSRMSSSGSSGALAVRESPYSHLLPLRQPGSGYSQGGVWPTCMDAAGWEQSASSLVSGLAR